MKKVFILSVLFATIGVVVPVAEAKTAGAAAMQERIAFYGSPVPQRRYGRVRRTVTTTRIRRVGPYRYRETIRITYLPNGRTRTQIIRRLRLAGRRW